MVKAKRLRSNASGRRRAFWEIDWTCHGCSKRKSYFTERTQTLEGKLLCNRCYNADYERRRTAKGAA